MSAARTLLGLGFVISMASCRPAGLSPAEHEADIIAWRAERMDELAGPDSWLTLVAYHYLPEGVTTMGSAAGNDLITPRGPGRIGVIERAGPGLRFVPAPGVQVLADSVVAPPEGIAINSDSDGDATTLRLEPMSWYVRDFQDRLAIRLRDNDNPLRVDFPGLEFYPLSSEWRVEALYIPWDPPKQLPVAIFTGGEHSETSPGSVHFQVEGVNYSMDVTDESETGYFLIFGDETNGSGSYPAGRYVWFDKPREGSDRVIVDFNKAYNPPCAFSEFATCPLPPRGHRIAERVEAGERTFVKL